MDHLKYFPLWRGDSPIVKLDNEDQKLNNLSDADNGLCYVILQIALLNGELGTRSFTPYPS
jgi:hypothetical protein